MLFLFNLLLFISYFVQSKQQQQIHNTLLLNDPKFNGTNI